MPPGTDVILRDGATLRLRPPAESDVETLAAFFDGLSTSSRFLRFHGLPRMGEQFVRTLVEPDWDERGALIGVVGGAGGESVVAIGNYVRLRERATAEAAFAVADDWQRRGIGTRLLEQLAERASERGIESFVAEVLPGNAAMLSVFENVGFTPTRTLDAGVVEVGFRSNRQWDTASASMSATTSASSRPWGRSSSRVRWLSSVRRRGEERSAASCSATSSPAASRCRIPGEPGWRAGGLGARLPVA